LPFAAAVAAAAARLLEVDMAVAAAEGKGV
jgi:hypothetical protein